MKLFVTGGAGFIGSALIRHVLTETLDVSVVNVDNLTYAACPGAVEEAVGTAPDRYRFIRADIRDEPRMRQLLKEQQPDAIMHLAAESHVDRSIDKPLDFIQTNVVGTCSLLQAALAHFESLGSEQREGFRFHHVSTDEVYGSLGPKGLFRENSAYAPNSPYSASKAASDHLVRAWHHTYGLPTLITNCSNNYGPWQFPEKLIPVVILKALAGEPIPVYGRGENIRDWLFVEDHARALMQVLQRGEVGEVYNIGGQNEWRNIDVVHLICSMLDELQPASAAYADRISFVADRPGHDARYAIDASKLEKTLGWRPTETFESGLRKTVQWYLENMKWCLEMQQRACAGKRLGLRQGAVL